MAQTPEDDRTMLPPRGAPAAARDTGASNALPEGTRLGEFELRGLVGVGGFGIVYLAYDHSLERNVALKEYMPAELARREAGLTVMVKSPRYAETFGLGLRSFVNEARLLAQFDHASLVKVYRFWEANGTAYMAMPFYEGFTFKETLRRLGRAPDEAWLTSVLVQLLDALEVIHSRQCYHRDIAPDNVLMIGGDTPVLLDFGAARRVVKDASQALTVILKPGYAPLEQYGESPSLKQGPWTDLYALASMFYFAITGRPPEPAIARVVVDPVRPLVELAAGCYSDAFLAALDAAMSVNPADRPQSIAELRDALGCGPLRNHPALRTVTRAPSTQPGRNPPAAEAAPRTAAAEPSTAPATQHDFPHSAEIERLLARYIGPMAKIIASRARKESSDVQTILTRMAEAVDDDKDRAEFLSVARKLR